MVIDPRKGRVIESKSIAVAVAGAGRMGQAVAASVEQQADLVLAGVWRRGEDIESLVKSADVLIDFSLPEGTDRVLDAAVAQDKPLVCGVSGLSDLQTDRVRDAGRQIPLLFDRNMSLGIAALERVVREAAASLGAEYAVDISEIHHIHKKDAPSGTALKLAEAIASSRNEEGTGTVSFDVERRGEVPGIHAITMRSANEELTFTHSVTTRQVFADGALRAVRWIVAQPPGLYSMQDVLSGGLR